MKYIEFKLENVNGCSVAAYLQTDGLSEQMEQRELPAIIICPGGAYQMVSDIEGEPVAKEYFAAGYHVFVLKYAVGVDAANFNPLCQLASTILHIRKCSKEWMIAKDKIAVCGFSAGGHLAASLGTLYNNDIFLKSWKKNGNIRPDAMILGYPVILSNEYAHKDSISNVSGNKPGSEEYEWFGLDRHVDQATPPTFLWHTASDDAVPVENSLQFASALSKFGVSFELHVFPEGVHGMSVCTEEVGNSNHYNGRWVQWSIQWLDSVFQFQK